VIDITLVWTSNGQEERHKDVLKIAKIVQRGSFPCVTVVGEVGICAVINIACCILGQLEYALLEKEADKEMTEDIGHIDQ